MRGAYSLCSIMWSMSLLVPTPTHIFPLSLVPSPAATTAGFLRTPGEEYTYPLGLRLPHVVLHNQGSGETGKTPPETEQAAGLPGSMIGFKIGGDSSADPGFERMFCLLTGVCCYRSAHAKGVRLASRSLFSQRRRVRRRAAECRGN